MRTMAGRFGEAAVFFSTTDALLSRLVEEGERQCKENIKDFAGRRVLIEGGGYHKVWLETQPMGGAMYGKRDLEVAYENQKIFMDYQREDGRLPGSVALEGDRLIPQFDKFQGFCFPQEALDVYYLIGRDREFLEQLYEVLLRFDAYLWKKRDSDGDGCLESFCRFDTGEDDARRYGDAPNAWEEEEPPRGREVVPMASMDFMSFSYASRETLAQVAAILGREEDSREHAKRAGLVREKMRSFLWDERRGAFFDRDRHHHLLPTLTHNNLRVMYWHACGKEEAERFVKEHLLNPEEFWTKMPLPCVAVNDPLFVNTTYNSWSGQSQALTYQRAIRALENYGYTWLIPVLGDHLFQAIGPSCRFVQQYDPFTMAPSLYGVDGDQKAYGPAILSVLEYVSRMYGVHLSQEKIYWGTCCLRGEDSVYEQRFSDHTYRLELSGKKAAGFIDGREVFQAERNYRIVTDLSGHVVGREDLRESLGFIL